MKPAWRICIIVALATLTLGFWLYQQDPPLRPPRITAAELEHTAQAKAELEAIDNILAEIIAVLKTFRDATDSPGLSAEEHRMAYENLADERRRLREIADGGPLAGERSFPGFWPYYNFLVQLIDSQAEMMNDEWLSDTMAHYTIARRLADTPFGSYQAHRSIHLMTNWHSVWMENLTALLPAQRQRLREMLNATEADMFQATYLMQWVVYHNYVEPTPAFYAEKKIEHPWLYRPNHTRNLYADYLERLEAPARAHDLPAIERLSEEWKTELEDWHYYNQTGNQVLLKKHLYNIHAFKLANEFHNSLDTLKQRLAELEADDQEAAP